MEAQLIDSLSVTCETGAREYNNAVYGCLMAVTNAVTIGMFLFKVVLVYCLKRVQVKFWFIAFRSSSGDLKRVQVKLFQIVGTA